MGADFKEKTKKSFNKCWDKAAVEANTPDLFRKSAKHAPVQFEAEPFENNILPIGSCVVVRVEDGRMIGRQGLSPMLVIPAPPEELIKSMAKGCNISQVEIVSFDSISSTYEVTFQ